MAGSTAVTTGPDCCVCLEPLCTEENTSLPCSHSFHSSCVRTWLRTVPVCPLCRLPVTRDGSAPAPPGEEGPNPLSVLWQFIAESTLNILRNRLREARLAGADAEAIGNSLSNQQFLMNLSQLIIENFVLAAAQNESMPRAFEARVALRASTSTGPGANGEGSTNEGDTSNRNQAVDEGTANYGNRRNVSENDRESNEGRLVVSFWEIVEETGRVVLVERFGVAARFSSNGEPLQGPPTLPQIGTTAENSRPRQDPTPSPAQQSQASTPTMTETDIDQDRQTVASQALSSPSRVSMDQSDVGSSASTTRRFAAKMLPRRPRRLRPTPEPVIEPEADDDVPPERRSFSSFRRWLRETMHKRPEASQPDNAEG